MQAVRLLIVALCSPLCLSAAAQGTRPDQDDSIQADAREVASRDWSADRMRDAEVFKIPVEEALPAPPAALPDDEVAGAAEPIDSGVEPFLLQSSGDPRSKPLKYSGRLFFTKPNGRNSTCSGQFIAPRVVLTAAHCVRDTETGQWYHNFRFALQYHEGEYRKQYGHACLATKNGWVKRKSSDRTPRQYDYAMLLVREESETGSFGWHYGWRGKYHQAVKIGYPADIERGRIIQTEVGPLFFPKDRPGIVGLRHGNPKSGPGSSGGAFVANYSGGHGDGINRVISVTSFSYSSAPDVDYGPYFDKGFESMLKYVAAGCRS